MSFGRSYHTFIQDKIGEMNSSVVQVVVKKGSEMSNKIREERTK